MAHISPSAKENQTRTPVYEETPLLRCQQIQQTKMSFLLCRWPVTNRKVLVDILAIWFGIGAWISINGLFVQLPLLVQTQPEGWNLPSFLSVIVQIANIGPILYSIFRHALPGKVRDSTLIYSIMIMGTLSLLFLALFYKKTTFLLGEERSTSLFILVFFISLVGCTSSVLFLPYMGNFREIYLISYFIGEGLSGFIPSIVALVQGVGGNPTCVNQTEPDGTTSIVPHTPLPNFSTEVYFFFLFAMSAVSTVCFFLLNNLPTSKQEKVSRKTLMLKDENSRNSNPKNSNMSPTPHGTSINSNKDVISTVSGSEYSDKEIDNIGDKDMNVNPLAPTSTVVGIDEPFSVPLNIYLLFVMAWVSGLGNGVFPSIQSYSCLPYGNVVYHLTATLGSMANPAACFLAFFLPTSSVPSISVLTTISIGFSSYIFATALESPSPPLVNTTLGEAIVVICWILNNGLISYVKMSIASLYRRQGGHGLFWCGSVQQIGSAIAALATFFLVNYAGIFTAYYPCE